MDSYSLGLQSAKHAALGTLYPGVDKAAPCPACGLSMPRETAPRDGEPLGPQEPHGPPTGGPPVEEHPPQLSADMFLNFVDSSSLLLLPAREAAEALVAQHRERLTLAKQQQQQAQQHQQQRGVVTCPPAPKRLRGPRRAAAVCGTRLATSMGAPAAGSSSLGPPGDEGPLLALERGLAARNTLHRLRTQVLELPKPNRHGVGLIYGARMSSDDGHDYR